MATIPLLRVVDLETTGDGFRDGGVVEVGWQDLRPGPDGAWALHGPPEARLVDPGHPITPATAAVHHITDEDVAGAPPWTEAGPPVLGAPGILALAAHRAAFEQRWCAPVTPRGARWICTWKCALRVWPEAPTHSNQGLRYWRRPAGLDRATGLPAHRAGPDAYVTAFHLRDLLAAVGLEQLLAWSAEPALLVRVPSGPLRGRPFALLDDDALARLEAGEAGRNADLLFTARTLRARRAAAAASPPDRADAPQQMPLGL